MNKPADLELQVQLNKAMREIFDIYAVGKSTNDAAANFHTALVSVLCTFIGDNVNKEAWLECAKDTGADILRVMTDASKEPSRALN